MPCERTRVDPGHGDPPRLPSSSPFIAAHLAAQFETIGATDYTQIEVNHEQLGPLTLTLQRQGGRRGYPLIGLSIDSVDG
jgi:hypothetical protein